MRLKVDDAFRLQYFSRTRSFAERSINHPFFGIYPASYMWGKIAPEMFRFMMKEPFGISTGAAAYSAARLQSSIALQREWDPEFDALIEKLGHNQAVWFMGYMLPAVPWDISTAAPNWMRDLARQAAENQARVDKGQAPKPIDLGRTIGKVSDYISPFRPITQIESALKGAVGTHALGAESSNASLLELMTDAPKPRKMLTPEEKAQYEAAQAPKGPTLATDIGKFVADDMEALKAILSR